MRLTLRTLLAWLDDTLPPAEVRQIGQQVAETRIAKELVDRIHKVTRQRRLTVPGQGDSEATDPNTVASYLDNELSPEQVAEFEKLCLASDVHLSEVASVHQILSLIGQKAKVPSEARHRMYRLVKGREAVNSSSPRAFAPAPPEPTAAVIPPWTAPEPQARRAWERYAPYAAVAALLAVLAWSAWSLAPSTSSPASDHQALVVAPKTKDRAEETPPKPEKDIAREKGAAIPKAASPLVNEPSNPPIQPGGEPAASKAAMPADTAEPADEAKPAASDLPPGAVGVHGKSEGILLRWNEDSRSWERLAAGAALRKDDRLVNLAPFRTEIRVGSVPLVLVGDVEVRLPAARAGEAGRLDLVRGRIVAQVAEKAGPFAILLGSKPLTIKTTGDRSIGVARLTHRDPGSPEPAPSFLRISPAEGAVAVGIGNDSETVTGPGSIDVRQPGRLSDNREGAVPPWVTDPKIPPADEERGKQLVRFFRAGESPVHALVAALEDDEESIRRLAVEGLGGCGEISIVLSAMSRRDAPDTRRFAIAFLRSFADQSIDAMKTLRDQLKQFGGDEWAAVVEKLLIGYSPKEAKDEATFSQLVKLLKHGDVGVRELAIDNLQRLTGRDPLEYNPDQPDGPGLKAWQDLLKKGELGTKPRAESKAATAK